MSIQKVTTSTLRQMKKDRQPITMITAYDYHFAKTFDEAGADMLLVGDSLGNVILGYDSTVPVTMQDMLHHCKPVVRAAKRAMVVADMPFMSYQISAKQALKNAGRFMQEAGAHAVKLEGGSETAQTVKKIVDAGIPVIAHIGLTPQSVHQMGGFKVQGKDDASAKKLIDDANSLVQAGAFCILLECVPAALAQMISDKILVPTIGIGAGAGCDGQVLVYHDMLGMTDGFVPKFAKQYKNLHQEIMQGAKQYITEVRARTFPAQEHCFKIDQQTLDKLY